MVMFSMGLLDVSLPFGSKEPLPPQGFYKSCVNISVESNIFACDARQNLVKNVSDGFFSCVCQDGVCKRIDMLLNHTPHVDSVRQLEACGVHGQEMQLVLTKLVSLQRRPVNCRHVKLAQYVNSGLGASVHSMTINMLRSYMDDAPIVNGVAMSSTVESAADMGTFNFGFCNQRNIECLFHNKSACKFGVIDVMRMRKANEHIFDWGNIPSKIPPNFPIHYQPNQHVPQLLPTRPELARKMLGIPGIFAAVSLFAAYVFDLNEQMLSSALNRARAMGLEIDKPYIGVHIRRAGGCSFAPLESCLKRDKHCWTGRKCTETSDYANYVRYLAERYHPRGDRYVVFRATLKGGWCGDMY